MKLLQKIKCRFGQHHRNRNRLGKTKDGETISRCTGCDVRLWYDAGRWSLTKPERIDVS